MPVAFISHGAGPWPLLDIGFPRDETASLLRHLREVPRLSATPPTALLVISAHWEAPVPTVMSSPNPPILYDYGGFGPEAYAITWPAPGDPVLAARVREMLAGAGFATAEDTKRGFDHGTFVSMKVAFPEARIPVVQLSLIQGLDASEHLRLGHALAPLRDEGVLIIGTDGQSRQPAHPFALPGRRPYEDTCRRRRRSRRAPHSAWTAPSGRPSARRRTASGRC